MSNPYQLQFNQDQLADFHSLIEGEVSSAFDAVSAGIYQATRDFARSLSPVTDADGNVLEEESPEWEQWVEALGELVWIENYRIDGFDPIAYGRAQLEAQLTAN